MLGLLYLLGEVKFGNLNITPKIIEIMEKLTPILKLQVLWALCLGANKMDLPKNVGAEKQLNLLLTRIGSKIDKNDRALFLNRWAFDKSLTKDSNQIGSRQDTIIKGGDGDKKTENRRDFATQIDEYPSKAYQDLKATLKKAAEIDVNLILEGESGTGKSFFARYIHNQSARKKQPFFVVDCGAISEDLFDAQFFGYVRGAFTGAHEDKNGYFQAANRGTILLDNIAELSQGSQAKILRALQEREIRKVGSTENETFDVRIMCTTQHPLKDLVELGVFRLDLYFRVDVINISVPPIRDRKEDLTKLIDSMKRSMGIQGNWKISRPVLAALKKYPWPGNLHELRNEIRRWNLVLKGQDTVEMDHLSAFITIIQTVDGLPKVDSSLIEKHGFDKVMDHIEKAAIQQAIKKYDGNIQRTSKALQLSRKRLRERLRKHQLYTE